MDEQKIPIKQKMFSCTVYMLNILMLFFPWITIGKKHYNILQLALAMKRTGLEALTVDITLFVENVDSLKVGIQIECAMFLIFAIFSLIYVIAVVRNRSSIWNVCALFVSVVCYGWNVGGDTIVSLNDSSILMWWFPGVFIILCTVEFIGGKAMEQWKEMNQKAEEYQAKERERKKEKKERLAFEGKYGPLFYQFLWKNSKKTWRDYALLVFCSSLVFFFIMIGFGMRALLKEENNIEGIVQAIGSLSRILLNVMFPLAIVSVAIIIILSFYYLKCRAKNYGIFLTLGMRKRTLKYFIALEFATVLIFTILIGGIFGTLILRLFVSRSESLLGARLDMIGVLPYIQSILALLLIYLIAFMAARDIFVSFNLGSSADLQTIKEKMPLKKRKFFISAGILLAIYSMFEYRQLRNFENPVLLLIFFAGLYLTIRYGMVEYLLREKKGEGNLHKLLIHNQLFHKSKTNTAYITVMSVLLFCGMFYFPFQFISVLIAEDEDTLYPYDIVCMANEEDSDIFERIQEEYQITLTAYPMVRVTNIDTTEKREGVMEPPPPQGQQIGISESTYQELQKSLNNEWKDRKLGLDSEGESVYIVHQQDKSVRGQPIDYWLSRKEPVLHIGVPVVGETLYSAGRENSGFYFRQIKGEEIRSLIGVFGQGEWDNLIVYSDEYFEKARELWKTTDAYTGREMAKEEAEEMKGIEGFFVQGPSELVLIRANEKDISGIEKELKTFRERHAMDESYNKAVQSCYIKKNAVQKLRTERIMKSVMNSLMFITFILIYFVLLIVKILMEREMIARRSEFLLCMGMRRMERERLIHLELFRYFYILPVAIAAVGAWIFTVLVFHARLYQPSDVRNYLRYGLPLWAICLMVTGLIVNIVLSGYARKVEGRNGKKK